MKATPETVRVGLAFLKLQGWLESKENFSFEIHSMGDDVGGKTWYKVELFDSSDGLMQETGRGYTIVEAIHKALEGAEMGFEALNREETHA